MTRRPKYRDQADTREQRVVSDQFGRPWLVTVEKETGDASGPLMPCRSEPQWAGVSDDLVPPMQYVIFSGEAVRVDTARWKADLLRMLNPREREPQRITHQQLATWRKVLAHVETQT